MYPPVWEKQGVNVDNRCIAGVPAHVAFAADKCPTTTFAARALVGLLLLNKY